MNVLVVKIGAIGDVVMALPMLSYLKGEKARITWVVGEQPSPLLAATGLVDELICVDEEKLLKGKVRELFKVWKKLGVRRFDLVLTAHVDWRYRLLTLFVRARVKRAFTRKGKRPFPIPGRYHAHEYLRLAADVEGGRAAFPSFAATARKGARVILAPGGAKNVRADDFLRRWPIHHYVALAHLLVKEGYSLCLTGAKSDLWVAAYFQEVICENFIGEKTLLELIALYKDARLLITHDSGPLHLAKLVDCPTIALFGPTNPYEKVGSGEKIRVLWGGEHLPCRPCYDGKRYALCARPLCLESISPERVYQEAKAFL
jgi:ADP-heptose:LPS heptosyltransferase